MLPFNVIGSDCGRQDLIPSQGMCAEICAGLFSSPIESSFIALSMGERYEVVIDFSNFSNRNITLRNGRGLGENVDYPGTDRVMRFVVGGSSSGGGSSVPQTLRYNEPVAPSASNAKDFTFERGSGGNWVINGVGFRDIENRILTKPERGTYETWALHNGAGGGTHPVHIHLVDFKVISRTGGRNEVADYESAGWKDVVWLAAGESVQVIARYAPWEGIYMFHCHNLVHEDNEYVLLLPRLHSVANVHQHARSVQRPQPRKVGLHERNHVLRPQPARIQGQKFQLGRLHRGRHQQQDRIPLQYQPLQQGQRRRCVRRA
jgi:bilirubin oxidase